MKLEARHIYKDKNNHLRLILAVNSIVVNYVYLYRTNIYEEIDDANILILCDDDYYACIDRVTYKYISDIMNDDLEDIEVMNKDDYDKVIHAITQYLTGEIVMYDEKFIYKDYYNKKKFRVIVYRSMNDTEIRTHDNIKIEEALEETREVDKIKFALNNGIWSETDSSNDKCIEVLASAAPDDLKDILNRAEKYNIRFKYDKTIVFDSNEIKFNLFSSNIPKNTVNGKPSKPRKNSRDYTRYFRNLQSYEFTLREVIMIANMTSANQVADRYRVSSSEGSIIYNNARRLLGYNIPNNKYIANTYTYYFNMGMTIDDVYNHYNGTIDRNIIKNNYDTWVVNGYGHNNDFVIKKWEDILNSGDVDILIDTYFNNTHMSFAEAEKCSLICASDIMNKIRNIIYKNPFVAAGFGAISFNRNALMQYASDAINSNKISDLIIANLYEMTNQLYDVYTETYDNHSLILTNDEFIPDEIKNNPTQVDCFKSLIWNRFNHDYMNFKRVLSLNQIQAIENGITKDIALLFMTRYESVATIKKSYYKIKHDKEKSEVMNRV